METLSMVAELTTAPAGKQFRLYCRISGLSFGRLELVPEFPTYGAVAGLAALRLEHPIFSLPQHHLLHLAKAAAFHVPEAETPAEDSRRLLLLAVLHSTGQLVVADSAKGQLPCPWTTTRHFHNLLSLVTEISAIDSPRLLLPKYKLAPENTNEAVDNLGGWIQACRSCIKEFASTKLAAEDKEKLAKAKRAKEFLQQELLTGAKQKPVALWAWIEVQLAPRHAPFRQDWRKLFLSADTTSCKAPISVLEAFEDAVLATADLGTTLSHVVLARIRQLRQASSDYYTMFDISDSVEELLAGADTDTMTEPKPVDFATSFQYKIARAKWLLANSTNRQGNQHPAAQSGRTTMENQL